MRLAEETIESIHKANEIIEEYQDQGFSLTLRQLYYQFVARDEFPADRLWTWNGRKWVRDLINGTNNAQPNYQWLGKVLNNGRLCGYVDWFAIEDRTRNLKKNPHWDTPAEVIDSARASYGIDMWENQPQRVEVWIEKEALVGVIDRVCRKNDVPFFACRGYVSQSEQYRAGIRFRNPHQWTTILHLGDHDPSGIDMTRDNSERLKMFAGYRQVHVERIALNMDQVQEFDPPPNPTKLTDSRAKEYISNFGHECWELDALQPKTLESLIQSHIDDIRDDDMWAIKEEQRDNDLATLDRIIEGLS